LAALDFVAVVLVVVLVAVPVVVGRLGVVMVLAMTVDWLLLVVADALVTIALEVESVVIVVVRLTKSVLRVVIPAAEQLPRNSSITS